MITVTGNHISDIIFATLTSAVTTVKYVWPILIFRSKTKLAHKIRTVIKKSDKRVSIMAFLYIISRTKRESKLAIFYQWSLFIVLIKALRAVWCPAE